MALSILNNISSLQAQNSLGATKTSLDKTLQQLSTGSRINSGADDAAGLAIANGLQANISALTQSARNATDGVGMFQVADGALSQVTNLLNRAVTLATESSTDTVSNGNQRGALDAEYQAIQAEISQIGANTNFNGGAVFGKSLAVFMSDGVSNSPISATTNTLSASQLLGGAATASLAFNALPTAAKTVTIGTGGAAVVYTFVAALTGVANEVKIDATAGASNAQKLASTMQNLAAAVNGGSGLGVVYGNGTVANTQATASAQGGEVTFTATAAGLGVIAGGGNIASATNDAAGSFLSGATFVGGAASNLLSDVSAQAALVQINSAIASVASSRGSLGAVINRLQAASNVMTNNVQNLTTSMSGIMSADIGQVTADMSKFTILQQTGIAALQQSNQMQQSVLKLLQ